MQAYLLLSCCPCEGRISGIVDSPNAVATLAIPTSIFDQVSRLDLYRYSYSDLIDSFFLSFILFRTETLDVSFSSTMDRN